MDSQRDWAINHFLVRPRLQAVRDTDLAMYGKLTSFLFRRSRCESGQGDGEDTAGRLGLDVRAAIHFPHHR